MRVRMLDPDTGDVRFGHGLNDFYIDRQEGVAQNVETRLGLYVADWFLDLTEGTPWRTQVLGKRTDATRDPAIRARILGTLGVTSIAAYSSQLSRTTRGWSVQATIDTAYGQALVSTATAGPNGDVRTSR